MFTGLIDDIGTIEQAEPRPEGVTFRVRTRYEDLATGESIALNGVCLTVLERGPRWFSAAAVGPTVSRTNVGAWRSGTKVNLERAMRPTDRLGGHIVQGHVDGVAEVTAAVIEGDAMLVDLLVPGDLAELMVPRGSIAVDGVSLTIQSVPTPDTVRIAVISHTRGHTTLGTLTRGSRVHVEADVVGKYVRRLVNGYT